MKTKLPGELMLSEINNLAAAFFSMHGKIVADGFKFHSATCELGRKCWNAAVITYFNEVIRKSGLTPDEYLLPELINQTSVHTPFKQPLVTY